MPDSTELAVAASDAELGRNWPADAVERRPIGDLVPYARNARTHSDAQVSQLAASMVEWGWTNPVLVDEQGGIIAGHGRILAAQRLRDGGRAGFDTVPVMVARGWSDAKKRSYILADNQLALNAGWDEQLLALELSDLTEMGADLGLIGFDAADLLAMMDGAEGGAGGGGAGHSGAGSLAERFGVPPFTVLNAREGWWQDRKRAWISRGIASDEGRAENLTYDVTSMSADFRDRILAAGGTTSIFDPVLCELGYRWFCPPGGLVLDPFAGGSVRGIVAAMLGREYVGVDLRPEQVEANRAQAERVCGAGIVPAWVEGDSAVVVPGLDVAADFVWSCPPYGDLEVYSDRADDLSNMDHADFIRAYRDIIAAAVGKLKPNRFAGVVVGDFRDGKGFYRNFVSDTISAFEDAGARLYNEAIVVTCVGSLPIRAGRAFASARKMGKTHQNCLFFVKGDPKLAAEAVGEIEFGEAEAEPDAADPAGDPDAQFGEAL
jgi:hypothetical protein